MYELKILKNLEYRCQCWRDKSSKRVIINREQVLLLSHHMAHAQVFQRKKNYGKQLNELKVGHTIEARRACIEYIWKLRRNADLEVSSSGAFASVWSG